MTGQPETKLATSGNRWDAIRGVVSGDAPLTGTYSVDVDGLRVPSMVPGNTQWLTPLIKSGVAPRLTNEQVDRALEYAIKTGNFKRSGEPMSPLGSEFDFFNPSGARLNDLRAIQIRDLFKKKPE